MSTQSGGGTAPGGVPARRIPVALQLYSVRKDAAENLPSVLRQVKEMGYEGVEFAGYYDRTAPELRALLDDTGLRVAGTHTGLKTVLDDELERTIEFNRIIGNTNLIVPSLPPERRSSLAAWRETAALFDQLAETLAVNGMKVGYHNHSHEFQPLEGQLPWEVFGRSTRPDVILQLDLGNAMHGGGDPLPALREFAERGVSVHLKDHDPENDRALVGEGKLDWQEVFRVCEGSSATEWYIVEQESYAYPPLECVRRCRENLRAMGR